MNQHHKINMPRVLFIPDLQRVSKPKTTVTTTNRQTSPILRMTLRDSSLRKPQRLSIKEPNSRAQSLELELQTKQKRSKVNRQMQLIHKIQTVEQQLDKWKNVRTNIDFLNKAKIQYVCDYYENLLSRQQSQTPKNSIHSEAIHLNRSMTDSENKPDLRQQRQQLIMNTRYNAGLKQIDLALKITQKKHSINRKALIPKRQFYNIQDIKNVAHFQSCM